MVVVVVLFNRKRLCHHGAHPPLGWCWCVPPPPPPFPSTTAWVANFEISDYFRQGAGSGGSFPYFARFNQYPERCHATHEEYVRLAEEERFGGKHVSSSGSGR